MKCFATCMTFGIGLLLYGCGSSQPKFGDINSSDPFLRATAMEERGDMINARPIFLALAQKGDCDAQKELAVDAYLRPDGPFVPEMVEWLQKAGNQGQPLAQLTLGDIYYQKPGVVAVGFKRPLPGLPARDLPEAYKWYILGEKNVWTRLDRSYAEKLLAAIRADMTPSEREEGERRAAGWQPSPQACSPRHYFSD